VAGFVLLNKTEQIPFPGKNGERKAVLLLKTGKKGMVFSMKGELFAFI